MVEKHKRLYKYLWVMLGSILIFLAWLEGYYINSVTFIGILILILLICNIILGYFLQRSERYLRIITVSSSSIAILFEIIWLAMNWYPAFVIAQILTIAIGFYCFYAGGKFSERYSNQGRSSTGFKIALRLIKSIAIVVVSLVSLVVIVNSISPNPLLRYIQGQTGDGNSYDAPATEQTVHDNGHSSVNDIKYSTEYPNSYLDVHIANGDMSSERPTYFYVHGGGWTKGDKYNVDHDYYKNILEAGYNIVSINYALSPEYNYPTPLIQLTQAVLFMKEHGDEYGIDMSQVIFAGGSAGGQIVGQFVNIQTNEDYAEEMGMNPVISSDYIKATVLDSAALDPERMNKTKSPSPHYDWAFFQFARSHFSISSLVHDTGENAKQGNVITHVTENFPPTFIADGNTATFLDQAKDLAEKLNNLGVPNYLYLIDKDKATLGHVFMGSDSKYTLDYTRKKIAFLNDIFN